MLHDLYDWVVSWAQTPMGDIALFVLAFAESSFFPIPPDVLLMALSVIRPEHAFWYAALCTLGSTLGGALGYGIGLKGGRMVLERVMRKERIAQVHGYFDRYNAWAIGIAGFTPIPYKLFTISAGVFFIRFKTFLLVSFLSRGARFFLVAGLISLFGEEVQDLVERYFNLFSVAFVLLLVGGYLAARWLAKRSAPNAEGSPEL